MYAALPPEQELLVEYKLFEPAFYATDLADWGTALLVCQKLGERARVLVDLGHHAQGVNIEQIVALLADEGRLGGFHFNNRKYADDDLIVGSVNPFELFLIFVRARGGGRAAAPDDRPVPQRRGQGRGDGAERRQPPGGLRQGAARRPRRAGRGPGRPATCSAATRSCSTPTAPTCARCARRVREELGAAEDPVAALRASGYAERIAEERASTATAPGVGDERTAPIDRLASRTAGPRRRRPGRRARRSCWPRTCSAPTARVANFGGGNTSAKGAADRPRRPRGRGRCGSRARAATWPR